MATTTTLNPAGDTAEVFTWTFPGAPVSIHLDGPLISRLAELTSGFESVETENGARGGILLGRTAADGTLEMTGCESAPAEPGNLHEAILRTRHRVIDQARGPGGQLCQVLGYYRTQTRGQLALDTADFQIINAAFREKQNVFLLVKPDGPAPSTAGFFFWDGDEIPGMCFLEFPLALPALPTERIARPVSQVPAEVTAPTFAPVLETAARTGTGRPPILWLVMGACLAVALGIGTAIFRQSRPPVQPQAGTGKRFEPPLGQPSAMPSSSQPVLLPRPPRVRMTANPADAARLPGGLPVANPPLPAKEIPAAPVQQAPTVAEAKPPVLPPPAVTRDSAPPQVSTASPVETSKAVPLQATPASPPERPPQARVVSRPEPARQSPPPQTSTAQAPASTPIQASTSPSVSEPRAIRQVQPTIPSGALRMLPGELVISVQLRIDPTGRVVDAVAQAPRGATADYFAKRAVAAARLWKFTPARVGTHTVSSEKVVTFRFHPATH